MTRIDIISGFLGAGKTTLIKKLLSEAFVGEKLVLIENEFGEINIDGGFLQEAGIQISEMSAGCICCSLVGDFGQALRDVQAQFSPDRILIEPSGVGKLSDVIAAVEDVARSDSNLALGSYSTVVDGSKCKIYMKNFGEFFLNQVENAGTVLLSRSQKLTAEKLEAAVALLRQANPKATIVTTPWDQVDGKELWAAMEKNSLSLADLLEEAHHHDEHCDCDCHGHHPHGEQEHCHDENCDCHGHEQEHEHAHAHGEDCGCGCHDHCHEHGHHADEVFSSWGRETPKLFTRTELERILAELDSGSYGKVLRAKGMLPTAEGQWLHFDYVPEEREVRTGSPSYTGRLCVIGAELNEGKLASLFGI